MVDDPNRKTPRQFHCRDYLWDAFEQLSGELECSVDYLINESMRQYLRAQGVSAGGRAPTPSAGQSPLPAPLPAPVISSSPVPRHGSAPSIPPQRPMTGGRPPIVPSPAGGLPPLPPARAPSMPAMPSMPSMPQHTMPPGSVSRGPVPPPVVQHSPSSPPPMPAAMPAMPAMPAAPAPSMALPPLPGSAPSVRTLYAVYADQEVPVTKEEFFIGRGQRLCDLVIRDTNISRQHARVVLHNGQYWMLDNQSTNGVEFRGAKIQQKRVDDGDVFTICGHEVHFVYR